jgi:hypothetical protein
MFNRRDFFDKSGKIICGVLIASTIKPSPTFYVKNGLITSVKYFY